MVPDNQSDVLANLRSLAASDPKKARIEFSSILDRHPEALEDLLESASRPGEGRLRQMIATVFRTTPRAIALEPWLRRWREVESDEFTRSAIESALDGRAAVHPQRQSSRLAVAHTTEAYRYVADRLCHRIRNALPLAGSHLRRLERFVEDSRDPATRLELTEILAGLQTGFRRVARHVEFDTGDGYLTWEAIPFAAWLDATAPEFAARFGPAKLSITGAPAVRRVKLHATRFLLETLFGNLWSNAIQAVEPLPCTIEFQCALDTGAGILDVLVLDNGSGFGAIHLETAFHQTFSTKSPSRGRGLLEAADAVIRLQGTVELSDIGSSEYRIHIRLPAEIA